jgi:three-Cys-motif partner protein
LLDQNYRYHFVYIDPFRPDDLPFRTIELLAKLERVDLFIHFPIGAIRRNLPIWKEGEYGILDEMLGTTEWRERLDELIKGKTLHTLLDIYHKQLFRAGFPEEGLKIVGSDQNVFSSLPSFPVKNTKDVELYALVLASKHPVAQKIWNSVLMVEPKGQRRLL